ncbi:MAG: filamentous hemagglutinin N-terminal domain-containing protein [Prochloraceae cyanobacterium]|nr:filamentous hemagglutinin N-terminal domain-containing protein [Prochloraceae cyanobacterium]
MPISINLKSRISFLKKFQGEKISSPLCFISAVFLGCVATTSLVQAQITSDGTLSTNITTSNNLDFTITNGKQLGGNLFHSFQQFSVPNGGSVSFANGLDVRNIFNRVTGNSISEINGLIQTNGSANLFLLNPNGIIFGRNAQLKVGGSFIASTASQINFDDGSIFSASDRQTEPLLTVSIPIGLQFREPPGNIVNRSIANQGNGLLLSGTTLALVGGDLFLEGGVLTTIGGRVELGSVAAPAYVSLIPINAGWQLGYESVQKFQDIHLSEKAVVQTAFGDIVLQARQIVLSGNSDIFSVNLSEAPGRRITVKASESVEITEDSNLFTRSRSTGAAADIIIETKQLLVRDNGSFIETSTESDGRGGNLTINATESVEVDGRGGFNRLSTQTFANGDAGTLNITTKSLILRNGGRLSSSTESFGNGGQVIINAIESIEVSGQGISFNEVKKSGVFAETRQTRGTEAKGNGGDITINTERLVVRDGAEISASSESSIGKGGEIRIQVGSFTLENGTISAETVSTQGGNITLTIDDRLNLRNSSKISTTAGTEGAGGDGGNITINAPFIIAFPKDNQITANAFLGNGGNINIDTNFIFGVPDFLEISASSQFGLAGTVAINSAGLEPSRGLVKLPENVVDPSEQIAQNPCRKGRGSKFVITGRGGLPPSLSEDLSSEATQVRLVEPAPMESRETGEQRSREAEEKTSTPKPIIPARGWIFNDKGEVVLVAYDTTKSEVQRHRHTPTQCSAP